MGYRFNADENAASLTRNIDKLIAVNREQLNKKYQGYSYPKTKEEYWKIVDLFWPEILGIISRYGPKLDEVDIEGVDLDIWAVKLEKLKQSRNPELSDIFNKVWGAAPDHGSIHANKAWDVFCDLCSEAGVLYEEEI